MFWTYFAHEIPKPPPVAAVAGEKSWGMDLFFHFIDLILGTGGRDQAAISSVVSMKPLGMVDRDPKNWTLPTDQTVSIRRLHRVSRFWSMRWVPHLQGFDQLQIVVGDIIVVGLWGWDYPHDLKLLGIP